MIYTGLITWALLGVLGLILQAVLLFKDALAAYHPTLQPALEWMCQWTDCQIAPLKIADAVVIDHVAIDQLPNHVLVDETMSIPPQWTFEVHLRNTAKVTVAMPWIELTLTDAQDQAVMRKVIDLTPLGAPRVLKPGEILTLKHQLSLRDPQIIFMGYRLLTFYP
ncbi:MAG: hypothetical protein RL650_1921 [Pseudomonadota bacterium]|jgi:hypothetical protein